MICGYRSTDDVVVMFHECCRVLRPGGVFLCVSRKCLGFLNISIWVRGFVAKKLTATWVALKRRPFESLLHR